MSFKSKIAPMLVGALMMGTSTVAYGQAAKMSSALEQFQSATTQLVKLHSGIKDAATAKAAAAKIAAAEKNKAAAAQAIEAALKKLDPKNEQAGKLAEKIFASMQKANQAVVEARLKAAAMGAKK